MSRTTYGYIAFKIPVIDGMADSEVVEVHQAIVSSMVDMLEAGGGSLTTLAEVAAKGASPAERITEKSVKEAIHDHKT